MEDYTINGLIVSIYNDYEAEDPTSWTTPDDRGACFALKHNRYNLPFEVDNAADDYQSWTEFANSNAPSNMPVYKFVRWYEHSGIAVSLRDDEGGRDWDAGIAGVIFGETVEAIEAAFEPWKAYIEGEVYGYTITNPKNGEVVDSCCGFYGYDDVKQCADSEAKAYEWPHEAAYAKTARELHR